jgi:hypothetical protein
VFSDGRMLERLEITVIIFIGTGKIASETLDTWG